MPNYNNITRKEAVLCPSKLAPAACRIAEPKNKACLLAPRKLQFKVKPQLQAVLIPGPYLC